MFCKWCGMESATTDQCSWCHRSFGSSTEAAAPATEEPLAEEAPAVDEFVEAPAPLAVPVQAPPPPVEAPPTVTPAPAQTGSEPPIIPLRRGRPDVPRPVPAAPAPARNKTAKLSPNMAVPPAPVRTPTTRLNPQTPAASTPQPGAPQASVAPPQSTPLPKPAAPTTRLSLPESLTRRLDQMPASVTDALAETPGLAEGVAAPVQPTAADLNVPQIGTFRAAKSKYYDGQVIDPASGTHYDADSGAPTAAPLSGSRRLAPNAPKVVEEDEEEETEGPPLATLVLRWVAAFAALLAIMAGVAHQFPHLSVGAMCVTVFLAAVLMPVMRAAPWQDDDSDDVVVFIILTVMFGPLISILFYIVLCAIRQDFAPAIAGLFLIAAAARLVDEAATGSLMTMRLLPWQTGHFDFRNIAIYWAGLIGLVGWYSANVFHKLDE